jgi:hypothetical protein
MMGIILFLSLIKNERHKVPLLAKGIGIWFFLMEGTKIPLLRGCCSLSFPNVFIGNPCQKDIDSCLKHAGMTVFAVILMKLQQPPY